MFIHQLHIRKSVLVWTLLILLVLVGSAVAESAAAPAAAAGPAAATVNDKYLPAASGAAAATATGERSPSTLALMFANPITLYIVIALACMCGFGFVTQTINKNKGYEGGFAWGFFLGFIGIIVVACKPSMIAPTNQYNSNSSSVGSESNTAELERLAKLHESGALSDAEFAEAKQKLILKM